jgi:hypothetical protein
MTTNQSIILICISGLMFAAGIIVGWLYEKRKRDKQMASICAERLLRKPEVSSSTQQPSGGMYANAAGMGQSNMGMFGGLLGNSALGSNPDLAQSQSQLGNNILSGILGKL